MPSGSRDKGTDLRRYSGSKDKGTDIRKYSASSLASLPSLTPKSTKDKSEKKLSLYAISADRATIDNISLGNDNANDGPRLSLSYSELAKPDLVDELAEAAKYHGSGSKESSKFSHLNLADDKNGKDKTEILSAESASDDHNDQSFEAESKYRLKRGKATAAKKGPGREDGSSAAAAFPSISGITKSNDEK